MTELQIAIATAMQKHVDSQSIIFALGKKNQSDYFAQAKKIEELTDKQLLALFIYGKRIVNDKYNAYAYQCKNPVPTKGEPKPFPKTPMSKETWFKNNFDQLGVTWGLKEDQEETISSPESDGWIAYFKKAQHKENGKPVDLKTLIRAQKTYARQALISGGVTDNLEDMVEKYFDQIIAQAEADTDAGSPGFFVELARKSKETQVKGFNPKGFTPV
jgi:hypothetical protein